ncbi:hypothetical protein [Streptomyces spiramenti]|uniref:Regulatory protein n=1 Tax=Streptomyces spiramenti TaxID=2720606 RepID=A0ABX1AP37_9ACTN|nr:hypothetical protein [Streptomyces spiramenti]NJP66035.1 hypothetical protein [Streptomyces spiramenti]
MARSTRVPNARLADLIDQARWTRTQLARAVNRVGREHGQELTYDQSAVSHWIAGTVPRAAVRPLVCEALSRRLRRPVSAVEAGFPPSAGSTWGGLVEELIDIGTADSDPGRRPALAAGVFEAAAMPPEFAELAARSHAVSSGRTSRIGAAEVETVRLMTERIADILDELGEGHARPMAAAFLANTVGPYLRAGATEDTSRAMRSAAADLVYLTGWMAMYGDAHRLGQRYYVKALELAAAADDHVTYCRTLRGMSLQATSLHHGHLALTLADSAAEAAPVASPRLTAFLRGQQAHAAAMTGDRRHALDRLAAAEAALSRADEQREHIGGYDRTAYLFHVGQVREQLADLPGSIRAIEESIRVQQPQERQGRMHAHAVLAKRQLRLGHLDAACASWTHFLDHYQRVSTGRGDKHLRELRAAVRPHRAARPVRQLLDQATEVAAAKAA